jgi:ParB family chromosome partitioning protein
LGELADSIQRYGVLCPLSVRAKMGRYELVAGERRLRAARLAGLTEVPCIVLDVDSAQSGAIALVENLQRQDLDYIEQAQGIARLIELFGLSQEECARQLGKSQSAVANKLRLLKLPQDILDKLRSGGLSERHGRALLRLPDDGLRRRALDYILSHHLTVAAADAYIDKLLSPPVEDPEPPGRTLFVLKDVRVFLNSLAHSVELMRQGGIGVSVEREESEEELTVMIHIRR